MIKIYADASKFICDLPLLTRADSGRLGATEAGNERFATGAVTAGTTSGEMRKALVKYNQAPHSAIIGCADSRVPVDTIFDATPGELFVLRNAGNTCSWANIALLEQMTKQKVMFGHVWTSMNMFGHALTCLDMF